MSRLFSIICLPLGFLVIFSGCTGSERPPQEPSVEITEASEPATLPAGNGTEPQESQAEAPDSAAAATKDQPDSGDIAANDTVALPETAIPPADQEPPETLEPNSPPSPAPSPEPEAQTVVAPPSEPETEPLAEPEETAEPTPSKVETKEEPQALPEPPAEPVPANEDRTAPLASFYEGYADILREFVQDDGRVDYSPLRRKRLRLKQLLGEPDELDPNVYQGWPEEEKLAFWINAYNLKVLDIIARNYPIQSSWWLRLTWPPSDIRHIGNIWNDYRFIVMDEEFTLGEVERRLFRTTFGDPRAFLAISYAARSGPPLRRDAYQGSRLDQQLDEQVRTFLSSDLGFRIDRDEKVVYLSALFKPSWRGKEFVGRYGTQKKFKDYPTETRAVLNFLTHYISQDDVYFLETENYTLAYMNFDWRLNDQGRGY